MVVDLEKAERVRAMFEVHEEPLGLCLKHGFAGLPPLLRLASMQGEVDPALRYAIGSAQDDLISLLTLVGRLQWQLELRDKGELGDGHWVYFTRLDIEYFFVVLRSVMDHAAAALKSIAPVPKGTPESFERMRKLARKDRGPSVLGQDTCDLVLGAEWFDDARAIRDGITHHGGWALAFITGETIPFQVYQGLRQRALIPDMMFNENTADFRKLSALLLAYVITLLQDVDRLVRERLRLLPEGPETYTTGPGTIVFAHWLAYLLGKEPPSYPQGQA